MQETRGGCKQPPAASAAFPSCVCRHLRSARRSSTVLPAAHRTRYCFFAVAGGKPGYHQIQGIGAGFVPKVLKTELLDEIVKVSSKEAVDMARRLALEEGLLGGISSGGRAVYSADKGALFHVFMILSAVTPRGRLGCVAGWPEHVPLSNGLAAGCQLEASPHDMSS